MPKEGKPIIDFDQLRATVPITAVLSHYGINLKPGATWYHGKCPLPTHAAMENKDFVVSVEGNFFSCSHPSCADKNRRNKKGEPSKGGDIVYLVSRIEKVSQYDAAALLETWFPVPATAPEVVAVEVVEEIAPVAKPAPEVVAIKAERFMESLGKKLRAEFQAIIEFLQSDDDRCPKEDRLSITIEKLEKVAKREVLASYRSGRESVLKAS